MPRIILLAISLLFSLSPAAAIAMPSDSAVLTRSKIEIIDGSYHRVSSILYDELMTDDLPDDIRPGEVWIDIRLSDKRLLVYRGQSPIKQLDHVAFGTSGSHPYRKQGSEQTPIGEFQVERINRASKFHRFFGIDYPNKRVADEALANSAITTAEHKYIHDYIDRHGVAPSDTSLGGHIGIHGLGRSDRFVHEVFNWTQGCVAVTNEEIIALSAYLAVGTRVIIRG